MPLRMAGEDKRWPKAAIPPVVQIPANKMGTNP